MFRTSITRLTQTRPHITHYTKTLAPMNAAASTTTTTTTAAKAMSTTATPPAAAETSNAAAARPKLTPSEEYAWNASWKGMTRFHDSHKRTFNNSYKHAADYKDAGYSLKGFLRESYNLVVHLGNHHAIVSSPPRTPLTFRRRPTSSRCLRTSTRRSAKAPSTRPTTRRFTTVSSATRSSCAPA